MQQPVAMRAAGKAFILYGVAVLALAAVILTFLGMGSDRFDYHLVEYASLGLVGLGVLPLVYVIFRQVTS